MLLDVKTRSVSVSVVTAYTIANSVKITSEFIDTIKERIIPITNLLTAVIGANVAVPAPADNTAREIQELTVFNGDSVAHDVVVNIVDGANGYTVKYAPALAANKTLYYNRLTGWVIV